MCPGNESLPSAADNVQHQDQVSRRRHIVNANDLNRPEALSMSHSRQRPGQALVDRPVEDAAREAFARNAEADGSAQPLEFLQARQKLQIVIRRFAEANSRIECGLCPRYTDIG